MARSVTVLGPPELTRGPNRKKGEDLLSCARRRGAVAHTNTSSFRMSQRMVGSRAAHWWNNRSYRIGGEDAESCTYGTRQKKCPDFLSTYRYFLSTLEGTSEGTSVAYCTVRLKHITHAKKFSREASSCTYTTHQRFCRQMPLLSSCHIRT